MCARTANASYVTQRLQSIWPLYGKAIIETMHLLSALFEIGSACALDCVCEDVACGRSSVVSHYRLLCCRRRFATRVGGPARSVPAAYRCCCLCANNARWSSTMSSFTTDALAHSALVLTRARFTVDVAVCQFHSTSRKQLYHRCSASD